MDKKDIKYNISKILSQIPKKILNLKSHEALAECILYELSNELCFHLSSISYIVYNPDFHLCKGIAGIAREDLAGWCNDPWGDIDSFFGIIKKTDFNSRIKEISFCTIKIETPDEIVNEIKKSVGNESLLSYKWNISNGNVGIILYKMVDENISIDEEDFENAAGIIALCPIGH